ncbi:hypothetical protein D3C78_1561920 [compost metagenome]
MVYNTSLLFLSHIKALLLASNSTGRVIILNIVIRVRPITPIPKTIGLKVKAINKTPIIKTHCKRLEVMLTTGTILERNRNQWYDLAC